MLDSNLALGTGDSTGIGSQLCGVRAADTRATEEPSVSNLFPPLEVTLEDMGVADGELCTLGDGNLSLWRYS